MRKGILKNWQLYTLLILPLAYMIIFRYIPMFGAQIAFRDYIVTKGIWASNWAGMKYINRFVSSYQFTRVMANTLILSFYYLLASFPLPIIFALGLNYIKNHRYKKFVQMVTYAPHFISVVVLVGMITQFFAPRIGIVNVLLNDIGIGQTEFLSNPSTFRHLYVWSGIWQSMGYSAIIYIAALAGVDPSLHEAAIVDGATKVQRIWHVDMPGIAPTAITLLILNTGKVLNIGFEKVYLLQNPLNYETSEIISTYVYKVGIKASIPMFSYSAAIGLFQSVIGLVLLLTVNYIAGKLSDTTLW